ncbi:transcription termination factor Rho [Haloferula luteola]|uniref:Transcription termination factor Rho n=1 Tax=Haloferula luteola TaxID=595692 RepID=A0A840VGY6_9BACT|nr:transcription termination factor Rho [Haloferula luteola]MBB5352041.1 transcription termination factor Rho [Haloferula luteola]
MSDEIPKSSTAEATESTPKPKAKKAAKKAVKTAAKKAVKKVATKKTAAKKTTAKKATAKKTAAKKSAQRRSGDEAQGRLDFESTAPTSTGSAASAPPVAPASAPAPVAESKPVAPAKVRSTEASAPSGARESSVAVAEDRGNRGDQRSSSDRFGGERDDSEGSGRGNRFGRVPGGGRIPRDPREHESRDDAGGPDDPRGERRKRRRRRRRKRGREGEGEGPDEGGNGSSHAPVPNERRTPALEGPKLEANGLLELAPKGFGFLRVPSKKFEQAKDDIFVSPELIRAHGLRLGQWIHGLYQEGSRGPQLVEILEINGDEPSKAKKWPAFEELKAVNPNKRISFETEGNRFTTRVVDLMSPVGRGQRGLIVSPPRSGKTTLLLHIAEAIRELHEETLHLIVLLVDERPEEVTEFRRCLPGAEIYASSNDEHPRNHTRIAELCIERAKRLVEQGKHVFLLMDSITRLARAYNGGMNGGKKRGIGTGGITVGALETPRRLFAAARNTREAGSLTILATALVQTNSRADEAIFQEFKGTGNMELVLDRKIAENYIYPAVDIFKSGTRREELILPEHTLHKIHMIRRGLSGHRPMEAMERLLFFLKKFPNNPQMLLEIKG